MIIQTKNTTKWLLTVVCYSCFSLAYGQGIDFSHLTWTEVLAQAKKEKKPIFLDAYASWCGPCKQMTKQTFTDAKVGEFFNQNFIPVKMDMEKGEGIALATQYEIQAYPTLLFLDENGKVLHQVCGFRNAETLLTDGENALNPEERFAFFAEKFKSGNRNPDFLKSFLQISIESCSDAEPVVEAYWKTQKPENYTDEYNWGMYLNFVKDIHSEQFTYLLANLEKFRNQYGDDPDYLIISIYENALKGKAIDYLRAVSNKSEETEQVYKDYKKLKEEILSQGYSKAPTLIYEFDLVFFDRLGWYDEYVQTAIAYVNHGVSEEQKADKLNQMAWKFYENVDDPKALAEALKWIQKSLEMVEAYANLDTYAALLFKTGDLENGQKMAQKAIEVAKENNQDSSATEDLIKKYVH